MRRALSIFLAFIIICSCALPVFSASPAVSISPSKSAVDKGDVITVSVSLSSGSDLAGIDLTVKYNTSEFQYVSGSVSKKGFFEMENTVDTTNGSIRFLGVSDSVVSRGGVIVAFKLKALTYGGKITVMVNEAVNSKNTDIKENVKTSGATIGCAHGDAKWTVTKASSCTVKGTETMKCHCGATDTRDLALKEHTVGKYTVTKEPTCTEKGTKKAVCTVCNKEYTEDIKATGHTYGEWVREKEPTETEKGLKWAECSTCGDKKEQVIPVINPTESTTDVEASTETVTEPTTFGEETTEPSNDKTDESNKPVAPLKEVSVPKIVITTVLATLGIEAIIGLIIFLILKNKKKKEQ